MTDKFPCVGGEVGDESAEEEEEDEAAAAPAVSATTSGGGGGTARMNKDLRTMSHQPFQSQVTQELH